jgi:hypothetical protein
MCKVLNNEKKLMKIKSLCVETKIRDLNRAISLIATYRNAYIKIGLTSLFFSML